MSDSEVINEDPASPEEEIIELDSDLMEFLGNILNDAQKSVSNHLKYLREIATKFENKSRVLVCHLAPFLDAIFLRFKKDTTVERIIDFYVKIATYNDNGQEWIDTITTQLIEYCLSKENAKSKAVRYRVCDIIGTLLKNMAETYELDEDLWERLETILLRRLKDRIPQVRQRAAFAIHRLSDPSAEDDPVRMGLIEMMDFDSNKDCRREALKSIDLSRRTVKIILRRCRDTSEEVRKTAFERLHQVDIRALSIRQRVDLLKSGLTERSEMVKKCAEKLLIERWLKNRDDDVIQLLKLLDIEEYESEAEIVLNCIMDAKVALTVDPPPYTIDKADNFDNEHLFYWRCRIEWFAKQKPMMQQDIDDSMPDTVEFVKLFESQTAAENTHASEQSYITQQLLILARYLNFQDEFSRSSLSRAAIKLLESHHISTNLIPLIMKLLRKLHCNDEEDYTRLIRETVEEIRNPIDTNNDMNLSILQKSQKEDELEQELKGLTKQRMELETLQKSSSLRSKFIDMSLMTNDEDESMNENDSDLKHKLESINHEIESVNTQLMQLEQRTEQTWIRMLMIITDLIQYTNLHWEHDYIKPMFEDIIVPTVIEKRPLVRAAGLKAFSLFLQMDKTNTQNNLILFLHILAGDGPASEYFALQALFDFLMIFDLFDGEAQSIDAEEGSVPLDDLPVSAPKSDRELIEILKEFLQHEDEELLVCAVEGFTKLLFMNRLKHCKLDVLTRLLLLYFNPVTEENDYVRQILSVFFPYYVDPKTFPNNRQYIAQCLMPCIRTCAYAPRENPLSQISTTKLTEYILWLLCADPLTEKDTASRETVNTNDTISLHEQLAFDILFEIDAHPEADQVRVLSRILTILQLNEENQHNLKQYKVLMDKLSTGDVVKNKASVKYLNKFKAKIDKLETHASQELDEEELLQLEEWRKEKVEAIQQQHLGYLSDAEKEEIEQELGIELSQYRDVLQQSDDDTQSVISRKKQLRGKKHENVEEFDAAATNTNQNNKAKQQQRKKKKQTKKTKKKKKKPTRRIVNKTSENENENEEEKMEMLTDNEETQQNKSVSTRGRRGSRGRGRGKSRKKRAAEDKDENEGTARKRRRISTNEEDRKGLRRSKRTAVLAAAPRRRSTRIAKQKT
eukprot:243921_1